MPDKPVILLVDDERAFRNNLGACLLDAGYSVKVARDGREALRIFTDSRPDLVLLDVMMPGMNGFAVCAEIRRLDRDTPVVFLSAMDSDCDQIRGLEVGADDYVSKSGSPRLLALRIEKALERGAKCAGVDAPVSMTKTEAAIFRLLASKPGRFFSCAGIFESAFGEGYAADGGLLRVHMSNIRRKLPNGLSLVARRGEGYAIVAD